MTTTDFYLIEEVIELIRSIEKTLSLNLVKEINLADAEQRIKINKLITGLDDLLKVAPHDPRLLTLVTQVRGLKEFLAVVQKAYADKRYAAVIEKAAAEKINKAIGSIVSALERWVKIAEQKALAPGNAHLKNLPVHPNPNMFYVMVKELNPRKIKVLHPFNPLQAEAQAKRKTEELLKPDPKDPFAGYRFILPEDNPAYPGSGIAIISGHHRLFELYKRYLKGELSGETLVEFVKAYTHS